MAGKSPQCMTQYDLLFGTSRVPAVGIDKARGVADNPKDRQHIIVAHNNLVGTLFGAVSSNSLSSLLSVCLIATSGISNAC